MLPLQSRQMIQQARQIRRFCSEMLIWYNVSIPRWKMPRNWRLALELEAREVGRTTKMYKIRSARMLQQKTKARKEVIHKLSQRQRQLQKRQSRLKNTPMWRSMKCQIKMVNVLLKKMLVRRDQSSTQHQTKEEAMAMLNHRLELFHKIRPPSGRTTNWVMMGGRVHTSSRPHM